MGIVSERAPRGASAAADQFLGSLGGGGGGGGSSGRQPEPDSRRDSSSSYRESSRPSSTAVTEVSPEP